MSWPDEEMQERNLAIYFERLDGNSFSQIAKKYRITIERVRQIYYNVARIRCRDLKLRIQIRTVNKPPIFVNELELTVRGFNCLRNLNITTIAELIEYPIEDLLKIHNMGRRTLNIIREELARHNLSLKDESHMFCLHPKHKCPNCGFEF